MTVSVVLGALVRDGQVLLAHRRPDKHAFPDVWDLPGGVVEDGETELVALVRELREELGVSISPEAVSHLCRLTVGVDEVLLSGWLVREWHGEPTNAAPDEHDDLRWWSLDDLPPPLHPPMREALLRAVRGG